MAPQIAFRSSLLGLIVLATACVRQTGPAPVSSETAVMAGPTQAAPPLAGAVASPSPAAGEESLAPPPPSIDVDILGGGGLILRGSYYPASAQPAPAVLMLHMYGRNRHDWADLATRMQAEGFTCLTIDLRGHGQTAGDEDWEMARQDVLLAWEWLTARPEVDQSRTGAVGASIGANLSLWLGAEQPGLAALALLSPGYEYFRVEIEGLIERYGQRPVFLAASDEDGYSAETVRALAAAASGPVDAVMYTAAGHGTQMLASEPDLADRLLAFFEAHLADGRAQD